MATAYDDLIDPRYLMAGAAQNGCDLAVPWRPSNWRVLFGSTEAQH